MSAADNDPARHRGYDASVTDGRQKIPLTEIRRLEAKPDGARENVMAQTGRTNKRPPRPQSPKRGRATYDNEAADIVAPLDLLLSDAALGIGRRLLPNRSWVRFGLA